MAKKQAKKSGIVTVKRYARHWPSKRRSAAKRHLPYKTTGKNA